MEYLVKMNISSHVISQKLLGDISRLVYNATLTTWDIDSEHCLEGPNDVCVWCAIKRCGM